MKGFTLLEVLIALVILSVGLLGLAGLQTTGLRNNHSAYLRSQATLLAYDIADRIRANKANLNAYALALSASAPSGTSVAETDLNEWLTNVENRLPEGDASVAINNEIVTIQVQWNDSRSTTMTSFSMTTGV